MVSLNPFSSPSLSGLVSGFFDDITIGSVAINSEDSSISGIDGFTANVITCSYLNVLVDENITQNITSSNIQCANLVVTGSAVLNVPSVLCNDDLFVENQVTAQDVLCENDLQVDNEGRVQHLRVSQSLNIQTWGGASVFKRDEIGDVLQTFYYENLRFRVTHGGDVYSSGGFYGTIKTPTQAEITALGTLSTLIVNGETTLANLVAGNISAESLVCSGCVAGSTLSGVITTSMQPGITEVGSLSNLEVTGTSNLGAVTATSLTCSGVVSGSAIAGVTLTGAINTAAQPGITSTGTLTCPSLTVQNNLYVDTNLIYTDAGSNKVGINMVPSNSQTLQVNGDVYVSGVTRSIWLENNSDFATTRMRLHSTGTNAYLDWGTGTMHFRSGVSPSFTAKMTISPTLVTSFLPLSATAYQIGGSNVLTATSLGNGVLSSNLSTLGNLTTLNVLGSITSPTITALQSSQSTLVGNVVILEASNVALSSRVGMLEGNVTLLQANVASLQASSVTLSDRIGLVEGNVSVLQSANTTAFSEIAGIRDKTDLFTVDTLGETLTLASGYELILDDVLASKLEATNDLFTTNFEATGISVVGVLQLNNNVYQVGGTTSLLETSTGNLICSGNVTAGGVTAGIISGALATAAQPNVTSLGELTQLVVSSPWTTNFIAPVEIFAANNIASGNVTQMRLGVSASTNNCAEIQFQYNSAGSASNRVRIGLNQATKQLTLQASTVGINQETPDTNFGVDCSGHYIKTKAICCRVSISVGGISISPNTSLFNNGASVQFDLKPSGLSSYGFIVSGGSYQGMYRAPIGGYYQVNILWRHTDGSGGVKGMKPMKYNGSTYTNIINIDDGIMWTPEDGSRRVGCYSDMLLLSQGEAVFPTNYGATDTSWAIMSVCLVSV